MKHKQITWPGSTGSRMKQQYIKFFRVILFVFILGGLFELFGVLAPPASAQQDDPTRTPVRIPTVRDLYIESRDEIAQEIGLPWDDNYRWIFYTGIYCEDVSTDSDHKPNAAGWQDTEATFFETESDASSEHVASTWQDWDNHNTVIIEHKSFTYEGLNALTYTWYSPEHWSGSIHKYAWIELDPNADFGGWYGFFTSTDCFDVFGDDVDDPWEYVLIMLDVLERHGWQSPLELGQTTPTPEVTATPVPAIALAEPDVEAESEREEDINHNLLTDPTTLPQGQIAWMTVAALAGVALGVAGAKAAAGPGRAIRPSKPQYAPSPVDGKMVPPAQVAREQSLLDQGFVFNPEKDGFDYVPKKVVQAKTSASILAKQAESSREQLRARGGVLDETIRKFHQESKDIIRRDQDFNQRDYRRHMASADRWDKASAVASAVKTGADITIKVGAKLTGPAGKTVEKFYDRAQDAVDLYQQVKDKGAQGALDFGKDKLIDEVKDYLGGKTLGDIPAIKTGNKYMDAIGNVISEELLDQAKGKAFDQGVGLVNDLVTGRPVIPQR